MKIYLGSDHQGFTLKEALESWLKKRGYDVEDIGNRVLDPQDDFPQFAQKAALKVLGSPNESIGILVCGGGQGMAMAANRYKGIRAAVVWDEFEAKKTRIDNDSNILCLPARVLDGDMNNVYDIVKAFTTTRFSGIARYQRRNNELDNCS